MAGDKSGYSVTTQGGEPDRIHIVNKESDSGETAFPSSAATECVAAPEGNLIHGRQAHIRFRLPNPRDTGLVAISMPMSRIGK